MFTQSDFDAMPKYSDLEYWFYVTRNGVEVISKASPDTRYNALVDKELGDLILDPEIIKNLDSDDYGAILSSWESFKFRPEYWLLYPINTISDPEHEYEMLFAACVFAKEVSGVEPKDPDNMWKYINKGLTWLRTTDFFICPASARYHDSKPGGLLNHTLGVAKRALDLLKTDSFADVPVESAVLTSLIHDWCKIGLYQPYMKNVKNEQTGEWEKVQAYTYNDDRAVCLGHGVASMYLAQKYVKLTYEECLAVRWHMGEYNVAHSEDSELAQANRNYPMVQLLQFADRLSITNF